ncbi:SWIM zinc finger family protein [Actinoplanes sp. NPDC051861]|uniref:SWIM zinc finger family protein n=1 Tax=Actinoplanes sp. NPDC051861 TaxID=3155170 RepID=UPI003419E298
MPAERWSTTQVEALAPDPASLRNARGVTGRFTESGEAGDVVWGVCRGYQVAADVSGPAFKCSCPSRKVPCKHALGLLLLWASSGLSESPAPSFATFRAARPRPSGPPDPVAAAKRVQERASRVAGGMAELSRWLDDQISQGLADFARQSVEPMAARLVDAQAPAAAGAVRRLSAASGAHWADRVLGELALLRLLVSAHSRLDSLDPGLAATVRSRIGFPTSTDEVLAGPRVSDRWQILGQTESDDGALTTRRTWLRGSATGRFALVLSFAAPGQALSNDLVPGTEFRGDLCFYPSSAPLRALVAARDSAAAPFGSPDGAGSIRDALSGWAALLAGEPWRYDAPVLLSSVRPGASGFLLDSEGSALPLAAGHREPWWLLAAAGAGPADVAAEWSPAGLRPLAAWVDGGFVRAGAPVFDPGGGGRRGAELPASLLAAALVGTARRPYPPSPSASSAGALLEAAAVALVSRRAGTTPSRDREPVPEAPPETEPLLPAPASARLARILGGGAPGGSHLEQELLAQWLDAAAERGGLIPPAMLPDLLEAGRRNTTIRAELARVAGRRGAWLAGQRPDWRWLLDEAIAVDVSDWHTATSAERLSHLAALRRSDPDRARELLEEAWKTEPSENRARFLGTFATGLSLRDEPLLENALDDRRKEVREAALELLRHLPGAGLGRRMAVRAHAAVRLLPPGRLIVEPPEELDDSLRRDGVGAAPIRGIGAGAWLLEEVLAGTPLSTWTEPAGGWVRPEVGGILELARGHDWATPLLHGWAKAAVTQRNAEWAAALLERDSGMLREAVRWDLHLVLPPEVLARLAAEALRKEDGSAHRLLALHPGPWPDHLAVAVLETVATRARNDRHTWQLGELCRTAALAMPPAYADLAGRLAAQLDQIVDPTRVRPVTDLARTLTFRAEMVQELARDTSHN